MYLVESLELTRDLLLVEPWDEEGVTPSGLYYDHSWEQVAGHAFGIVLKKSELVSSNMEESMSEVFEGDLVLFTRGAHIKAYFDKPLLFVSIEDVIAVLEPAAGDEHPLERRELRDFPRGGTALGLR